MYMDAILRQIRGIADFQYGNGAGLVLFPEDINIVYSKNTGRIRHVTHNNQLIASFRPTDGLFTLSIKGAERLINQMRGFDYIVEIMDEISEFPSGGSDVFAKHVVNAGCVVKPGDEVIVVDSGSNVLAVGKALMNKIEMLSFQTGVAVRVRKSRDKNR
jgi:predicted RNA-binding protein (TIGR00451 family)